MIIIILFQRFICRSKSEPLFFSRWKHPAICDVYELFFMHCIQRNVFFRYLNKRIFVLLCYRQKELFQALCNALWAANNNLHLWAASSSKQPIPKKWKKVEYQPIISCPPSILRERELISIADKEKFTNLINLDLNKIGVAPTEGLPVKIVYHSGEGHSESKAFSCTKCSSCVVDLLKALHIKQHSKYKVFTFINLTNEMHRFIHKLCTFHDL